jgi:hypothetical protein
MTLGGVSAAATALVVEVEDGPAENRTPNPLIKSSLADTPTADHHRLPPGISKEDEL